MYTLIDRIISVFGTFELTEDKIKVIGTHFPELKVGIGKDQHGNVAGRIQDPNGKSPLALGFGRNRVDCFLGSATSKDSRAELLKMIDALVVALDEIKDYGINRLAYNGRAFLEDSMGVKRVLLGSKVPLLNTDSPMIETSVRLNYREEYLNEEINNIISIQDGNVTSKETNTSTKALIMGADVNTIGQKQEARFTKDDFEPMFIRFLELATKSFENLDELLK